MVREHADRTSPPLLPHNSPHDLRDGWTSSAWTQRIDTAPTPDDVMCLVRGFVGCLDHAALARLPPACLPPRRFESEADVTAYAYDLLRSGRGPVGDGAALVERMGTLFARASVRLAQLRAYDTQRKAAASSRG